MQRTDPKALFPYWAQVWPASLAMAIYIQQHIELIKDKQVLELAAGLGLPSFIAARYASNVCCSDYLPEALAVVEQNITYNRVENLSTRLLNWHNLPKDLNPDVLLLSDINYDPKEFEILYQVIHSFLQKNTLIILSTPQRLMAKPFIELLLPWIYSQEEIQIKHLDQIVSTSVFILQEKTN